MYKALITDLDGTAIPLSGDGSTVDDDTSRAIQRAHDAGKIITCATGREWAAAKPVIEALGITAPCIIEGGTRIINPNTEETLWEKDLDDASAHRIVEIFRELGPLGQVIHSADPIWPKLSDLHQIPNSLRFIYLLGVNHDICLATKARVNELPNVVGHITPSWAGEELYDVHVTHSRATKEHAIHIWQDMHNITIAETIGMGDSGNDLPIFHASGLKVAVGNATSELNEAADEIAPSVEDNALRYVIEKYLLAK